jgi:hypothetical protein
VYGVLYQKMVLFIVTAVRIADLTKHLQQRARELWRAEEKCG